MKGLPLWIAATRAWSFPMTAISVTLGSFAALAVTPFRWGHYFVVMVGMILVHAATNMINDYFDVRHGVDRPDSPTARYRHHPLVAGTLRQRDVLAAVLAAYGVAAAIGIGLVALCGWYVLFAAGVGLLASLFYTAGPVRYKHHALGEVSVFLMWGPLMVSGAFAVQVGGTGSLARPLLLSLPQGLWVALVLFANNLKDIDYDARVRVTTLATYLGKQKSLRLFVVLCALCYLSVAVEVVVGLLPILALLVFLSAPMTWRLVAKLWKAEIPSNADPLTAQAATLFGVLLVFGLLGGHFLALP